MCPMAIADEPFMEVAETWDLETLYTDLASAKGKRLTPIEKRHLRGLLCGYSPTEIAEKLHKSAKGLGVDLCSTLYIYVKNLLGKTTEKVENWRNIAEWLEEAGYKTKSSVPLQVGDCLSLDIVIKKANIIIEKNQLFIDINIRLATPINSDPLTTEEFNQNHQNGRG